MLLELSLQIKLPNAFEFLFQDNFDDDIFVETFRSHPRDGFGGGGRWPVKRRRRRRRKEETFLLLFLGAQRGVLFTRDGGETILMRSDALDASNRPRFNTQKKREKKQKHPRVKL